MGKREKEENSLREKWRLKRLDAGHNTAAAQCIVSHLQLTRIHANMSPSRAHKCSYLYIPDSVSGLTFVSDPLKMVHVHMYLRGCEVGRAGVNFARIQVCACACTSRCTPSTFCTCVHARIHMHTLFK